MVSRFSTNKKGCLQTQQNIKSHLLGASLKSSLFLIGTFFRKLRIGILHCITFPPSWVFLRRHPGASQRGCFLPSKVCWLLQWHRCAFFVVQLVSGNVYNYYVISRKCVYMLLTPVSIRLITSPV